MPYNPDLHHRRSIRLQNYDYGQQGAYFVTICSYQKECLFGEVVDNQMKLNEIGLLVQKEWLRTEEFRRNVGLDEFIVMPNHLHALIVIENSGQAVPSQPATNKFRNRPDTLGTIMRGFKAAATSKVNALRNLPDAPLWQRNYYEHIVRDEPELMRIREYIVTNPARWQQDKYNPTNS